MKNTSVRGYIFAGLVVWLPILVTFVVLRFIVDLLDQTMALIPGRFQPEHLFGIHLPGFGVVLSFVLLLVTGIIATNFLGQRLVRWSEAILDRIPLVRTIYNATKQVMQALFSSQSNAFRQVLLVEYPRKGLWSLAFQTGSINHELATHLGPDMLTIFIPATPNPTAGFLMMIPKKDTIALSMSIDEALKLILSLGVMQSSKPAQGLERL